MNYSKDKIVRIMSKYIDNRASESECLTLMDALGGSEKLRLQLNLMAAGLKRMSKRRQF